MALDDMLRGLEDMLSKIESLSRNRPFTETLQTMWNAGPRAEVFEQGQHVKVVVEADGLRSTGPHKWSAKVDNNRALLLKGMMNVAETARSEDGRYYSQRRAEQFTRVIPLPCRVESRPEKVRLQDGLLTLHFRKMAGKDDDGWFELNG